MRLYLSSLGVPNRRELLSLIPEHGEKTVAIIPNAWDVFPEEQQTSEVKKLHDLFEGVGFETSLIDLRELRGDDLRQALLSHTLIWFMGGNTFHLNYLVRQTGLGGFIEDLLEQGLVYGGESAGAVLAGTTLRGVQNLDDPAQTSKTIWDGLSLVDFGIVPHYGMKQSAAELERCKLEMEKYTKVMTISNSQALVVNGGVVRVVQKDSQ